MTGARRVNRAVEASLPPLALTDRSHPATVAPPAIGNASDDGRSFHRRHPVIAKLLILWIVLMLVGQTILILMTVPAGSAERRSIAQVDDTPATRLPVRRPPGT